MSERNPVIVLCCVGLTPQLIGPHTPHINQVIERGFMSPLDPSIPAVTCTAQTTMLTGVDPTEHGIVGNGWYFRELGEVWLWRQSQRLVNTPCVWQELRDTQGSCSLLKHFWWYAMNTDADISVTPRPAYHADGAKSPDIYSWPPDIKESLLKEHGPFPLFKFWGPLSSIVSTNWIADTFCSLLQSHPQDLSLCYLPHLDYDFQRFGAEGAHVEQNVRDLDACVGRILQHIDLDKQRLLIVSEYGIENCHAGIPINQALREAGLLAVTVNATGEILDSGQSKAFAVCDHQLAHIYCQDADALQAAQEKIRRLPGIDRLFILDERKEIGLNHPRSGEIIALAAPGYWFQYDYWLDANKRPDFANSIEIHKKPGYDPRELFFDPKGGKWRSAKALLRKKLGMRYVMNPVPLDPTLVKGTHGRAPSQPELGPVIISSDTGVERDYWHQRDVAAAIKQLMWS